MSYSNSTIQNLYWLYSPLQSLNIGFLLAFRLSYYGMYSVIITIPGVKFIETLKYAILMAAAFNIC